MVAVKKSKAIDKIVKGDTIKIDGKPYEVDAHYMLMDHGHTKEMAIEVFDPKTKKEEEGEAQVRYFSDNMEDTIKFFVLKTIMYEEQDVKKIEW